MKRLGILLLASLLALLLLILLAAQIVASPPALSSASPPSLADHVRNQEDIPVDRISTTISPALNWKWQRGDHAMHALHFVNANQGWAVGDWGFIVRTTDGGQTWTRQESGVANHLYDVYFVNTTTGWAIGSQGTILRTVNGGQTWQVQSSPTSEELLKVFFLDAQRGWIGYKGHLLKTTNGGQTWTITGNGISDLVNSLQFFDANNGVLASYRYMSPAGGRILLTSDGGANWTPATCPGSSTLVKALYFPTRMKGIAVGGWVDPVVLLSSDGGLTWQEQEPGVDYIRPDSVHFYDANYGLAADSGAFGIIRTSNGGLSWVRSENTRSPQDVQLVSQSKAFVADFQQGVYVSTDGGATFSLPEAFSDTVFYGVHFVSNREGWIVGAKYNGYQQGYTGKILHTTNGGETWQVQRTDDSYLKAVHFINRLRGWAVGGSGKILSTTTGGVTWTVQTVDTWYILQDLDFVDESYGWTVGTRTDYGGQAKIWCTTDGGGHWQECGYYWVGEWPGDEAKYGIDFVNRSVGYVVGKNEAGWGSVFKTTNGGARWVEKPLGGNYPVLHGVYFLNANEGWVVGENGFIAHTSNGGDTWDVQSSGTTVGLCKVAFVDNLRGYAMGDCYEHGIYGGVVLKTTNGGLTWAEETTGTRAGILDVAFPDRYHVWIVGNDGMIRTYTDPNIPRREGWVPLVLRLR